MWLRISTSRIDSVIECKWPYRILVSGNGYMQTKEFTNVWLHVDVVNGISVFALNFKLNFFSSTCMCLVFLLVHAQILSDENRRRTYDLTGETSDSPQSRGPAPGQGFTVFQSGNTFHFRFNTGGPRQRGDGVTTSAFFSSILPGSHHKPYLLNFYHDFCLQCVDVERIWQELKDVSLTHVPGLVPRPHPAFHYLQYGKAGRAWYLFSSEYDVIDKWQRTKKWTFTYCSTNYEFNAWCV